MSEMQPHAGKKFCRTRRFARVDDEVGEKIGWVRYYEECAHRMVQDLAVELLKNGAIKLERREVDETGEHDLIVSIVVGGIIELKTDPLWPLKPTLFSVLRYWWHNR